MSKDDRLKKWVLEAVKSNGGEATLTQVAKHLWDNHEDELRSLGSGFYSWQYDMRWAAQYLRDEGVFAPRIPLLAEFGAYKLRGLNRDAKT